MFTVYIIPRFRRREGEADDKNDIVELHPWTVWWQLEESSASSPQSKSGSPDIASSLGVKFRLHLSLFVFSNRAKCLPTDRKLARVLLLPFELGT